VVVCWGKEDIYLGKKSYYLYTTTTTFTTIYNIYFNRVEVYLGILKRIVLTCFKGRHGGGSFERSIRIYQISGL